MAENEGAGAGVPHADAGGDTNGQPTPSGSGSIGINWTAAIEVIKARKLDAAMWASRLCTLMFAFFYLVPILGSPTNCYYKAFLASAATSALRLHQRLPAVQFSRIFLGQMLMEDSCHYIFYSLIFVYCSPITLALLPISLFALLHFASFSLNLLDALELSNAWLTRTFVNMMEFQTVTILRMAAGAEIFTMLFAILYTFVGRASLITPFVYYRFLSLRYASRRNHYTRAMFNEIRIFLDQRIASSPKCPSIISTIIRKMIEIVSRLAPQMEQQAQ